MGSKRSVKREIYHNLLKSGHRRLRPEQEQPDPLGPLVEEYFTRRMSGEKVSIRGFCSEKKLPQRQFEARLNRTAAEPDIITVPEVVQTYYGRSDVQRALFLWAQGRRLALHFSRGVISQGFKKPSDIGILAAACTTSVPTFHASVGRYTGGMLTSFDLVAEVDIKGNWQACFKATRPLVHSLYDAGVTFIVKFSGHSSAHVIVPCKGSNYNQAAGAFLAKVPGSMKGTGKLDLSFRDPKHFLRMPYALHERTGLVSLPLTRDQFDNFDPDMALPGNISIDFAHLEKFLATDNTDWVSDQMLP